ncbi:hypothetical protein GTP46_23620 [Duganella sp. FT135W]|uniref:Putative zinc-finger domain-containing protein n=1 Tax=Duganella flavida TaxID=2692175 RepID=A0A6L8KEX9_9BURK|nr:zf-HC2 domain-containing protein [Duganella flavida]MYM25625.1 hypothetical protein [Duganella flavida]
MSTNITTHNALQELLPWYASGSLEAEEARRVQEHLQQCAACRADLAWQRKLLETEGPLPAGLDPERALARLMPQLDATPATAPARAADTAAAPQAARPQPRSSPTPRGWGERLRAWLGDGGWQGWAIAAQCAVIAVLAVQLLPRGAAPTYQALGHGAAATPDLLVVFKPDARLQDVQRLMQENGAQIVGGPTVTGAYILDVDAGHQAQLLAALRAHPSVELAESLTAAGQP